VSREIARCSVSPRFEWSPDVWPLQIGRPLLGLADPPAFAFLAGVIGVSLKAAARSLGSRL